MIGKEDKKLYNILRAQIKNFVYTVDTLEYLI